MELSGKAILITGASSGIGRETAILASKEDATIIIVGRNTERLEKTKMQCSKNTSSVTCDLTIDEEMERMCDNMPQLDGIALCAGINEYVPAKSISNKRINKIFDINFNSQILLVQKLLKKKKLNGCASIVFISSISSLMGVPATLTYAASKSAVNAAARVLASELAPQKIRVNVICPGIINTDMLEGQNIDKSQFLEQEKLYPLGLGKPSDIANAIIFHLSDKTRWLTGNIMILDGGFLLNK